jgi:hypothetical protein
MAKAERDYSNTVFYKIYCKDPSVNDIYIGRTIDFVRRKCTHMYCCINPKASNHNYKLYNIK